MSGAEGIEMHNWHSRFLFEEMFERYFFICFDWQREFKD